MKIEILRANLVPLCSATWRCQLLFTVNCRPHSLHTNGLIPRWDRMCCSSNASLRYAYRNEYQIWAFLQICICTFLHSVHLKGRCLWFLCCHLWLSRLHLATNCFLQISQLYGFCPWCFTLKRIKLGNRKIMRDNMRPLVLEKIPLWFFWNFVNFHLPAWSW